MNAILLILLAASVGHGVAKLLRLPHVPLLILAGGALDFFNAPIDPNIARDVLLLGLTFLVFISGTSLNPWRIGERGTVSILLGTAQFLVIGIISFVLCKLIGLGTVESVYLSLALASSSTLVIIKILQLRGELFEPFGRIMVGSLLVQDILMIFVISALSVWAQGWFAVATSGMYVVSLSLLGLTCKRWIIPWLLISKYSDEENQLLLALMVPFGFMAISEFFGLPFLVGAFIAGIALSAFPVNGILKGQFASLNDFFNAIFFTSLGFFVDIPSGDHLWIMVLLAIVLILLTPIVSAIISLAVGMTIRTGIEAGLLLAQTSEFSIILGLMGMENKDLSQGHLSLITSITVITMIVTPFLSNEKLASLIMAKTLNLLRGKKEFKKHSDHYVLIGCGESALIVLNMLKRAGEEVVVIDDDAGALRRAREYNVDTILGNGKDPIILKQACLSEAKLIISSMRKFSDNKAILGYALSVPKVIRVFDQYEAEEFERLGAISIPATEAASADLINWVERSLKGS